MLRRQLSASVFVVVAVLCSAISVAVEFDAKRLDLIPARMQEFVDSHQLAGAVTAIGTKEGLVRVDAVGRLSLEAEPPMPKDAIFRIASMTKPVTAMAIMILADRGKLAVTDTVEQHLPEFRGQLLVTSRNEKAGITILEKPSRPITIRDLMTHTSGLPSGFPPGLAGLYSTRHLSLAEAVLVSSQRPLDFEPGSKWSYCNAGIDTLGRIVEVISGRNFEDFVAENIFQPLGMRDTSFYPSSEQLARVPPVYDVKDGKLVAAQSILIGPPTGARHPIPAGGLYSTASDLAKLYQMTLNGGKAGDRQILSTSALAEMTRLQTGDLQCGFVPGMGFGYGFAVVREPQGVTGMLSAGTFGHGGAFGTQGWIDPQQGVFVILLIQRVGLKNGDGSEMRQELQRLAFEAVRG
jgi:CubicO group peptidase (beta-lactamase class C family)